MKHGNENRSHFRARKLTANREEQTLTTRTIIKAKEGIHIRLSLSTHAYIIHGKKEKKASKTFRNAGRKHTYIILNNLFIVAHQFSGENKNKTHKNPSHFGHHFHFY